MYQVTSPFLNSHQRARTAVHTESDPPLDANRRASIHVQGVAPCLVPSATNDDSHLPHARTTEESGRLVARARHCGVGRELHYRMTWVLSCNFCLYTYQCTYTATTTNACACATITVIECTLFKYWRPVCTRNVMWACMHLELHES